MSHLEPGISEAAPKAKILCVDDEPNILSSLRRLFRSKGYQVTTAVGGQEGLNALEKEPYDLIISDMRMPEMDGAQFLQRVREQWPKSMRILLTGYSDMQSVVSAINLGEIHRYITKPWNESDILLVVQQALERKFLIDEKERLEKLTTRQNEELRQLNTSLESKVQERTADLKSANDKLRESFVTSIKVFSALVEMRSGHLIGHSRRVADLARKIAQHMHLNATEVQDIFVAGLLVDIGKIGFSDELLSTPVNQMNGEQLGLFHKHAVRAEQVLTALETLQMSSKILRSQHERVDGRGFPDGLTQYQIPLGARILAVSSDYHNLLNGVLAQKKLTSEDAQTFIIRNQGVRYDDEVVDAFKHIFHHVDEETMIEQETAAQDLQVGMILSNDVISRDGILLLPADYVLTESVIEKIQLFSASTGGNLSLRVRTRRNP